MCDKRNNFCYACGLFVDRQHRVELRKNKAVIEALNLFFKCSYVESAWFEPEVVCLTCSMHLKKWKSGKHNDLGLPFVAPMAWHYQTYHKPNDCYFCQTNIDGYRYKSRHCIKYADVLSVSKPILREKADEATVDRKPESVSESSPQFSNERIDQPYIPTGTRGTERHFVTYQDYCDLVRDLELSTRQTEKLASRLKQWNLVENDFKVTLGRDKDLTSLERVFDTDDNDNNLVYCVDVDKLFAALDHEHCPQDWRLFLDGSCKSEYLLFCVCERTKIK